MNAQALPPRPVAYTVPEIAKICRVGTHAVYDALNEGRLSRIKMGNRKVVGAETLHRRLNPVGLPDEAEEESTGLSTCCWTASVV